MAKIPRVSPGAAPALSERDRQILPMNVEFPLYVWDGIETYMADHPGSTLRTLTMEGFRRLGIAIEDQDLVPERGRRKARARSSAETDTPETPRATSLRLPRYVRARGEAYLLEHPEMRFRHLVMAGFKALGIFVRPEDLIAIRTNVLAQARSDA